MKKFKEFLIETDELTAAPANPGQGTGIDPRMFDPKLSPPIELDPRYRGPDPREPGYTEQELYDIIDEILRRLNAGCPTPCFSDEEIAHMREVLRRTATAIRNGQYGTNLSDNGMGVIRRELKHLLSNTELYYDLFHNNEAAPNPSKFWDDAFDGNL